MAALLLLLLSIEVLIFSGNTQENNYDRLPESYKKGVDLALEKLHSHAGIQQHFLFLRSLLQLDIQAGFHVKYIYHHFYLNATNCAVNSTACQFRNDRPLVDCAMCYKTLRDDIQPKPKLYIHCVNKTDVTRAMRVAREEHCNRMGRRSGAPSLLATEGIK